MSDNAVNELMEELDERVIDIARVAKVVKVAVDFLSAWLS